jgi:hypothetical protein
MITQLLSYFAAPGCNEHTFFLLPTWYKYLVAANKMVPDAVTGRCDFVSGFQVVDLSLILLALLDIALRVAGLVAVAFVVYGGVKLVTSQGDPEASKGARKTIINALIGLVIALLATSFVAFIGTRLG